MLWSWWLWILALGLILGGIGAWSKGAWRVFMTTLALPIALVITRIWFPEKNSPWYFGYLMIDLVVISLGALISDYLFGLALGRNDKHGNRDDDTPHDHHDHMNPV